MGNLGIPWDSNEGMMGTLGFHFPLSKPEKEKFVGKVNLGFLGIPNRQQWGPCGSLWIRKRASPRPRIPRDSNEARRSEQQAEPFEKVRWKRTSHSKYSESLV